MEFDEGVLFFTKKVAVELEKHIDKGFITNPRDAFMWMLGYAFDTETGDRLYDKIIAAEDKEGETK